MKEKNISFLGLPSSGKTTFLAALWHLILTGEVECDLSLDGFTNEYPYLNSIHEKWLDGNPVNRTPLESAQIAKLNLKFNGNGEKFTLHIPDLSGEEFELQLNRKKIKLSTFDNINKSNGIIMFLSADKKDSDIYFHELNGEKNQTRELKLNWDYHSIPTQVKIVELMQTLLSQPFSNEIYKVAIVISAWDIATPRNIKPEKWIEVEYPLLHQFLHSNNESFVMKFYGVSAQGGDLNNADKKRDLTMMQEASKRIICQDGDDVTNDITKPLTWIINTND